MRKFICTIVLITYMTNFVGCTAKKYIVKKYIFKEEISELEKATIVWITTQDDVTVKVGNVRVEGTTISGVTKEGRLLKFDIHDIKLMWIESRGEPRGPGAGLVYLLAVIGGATIIVVTVASLTSCPFVYSFDGHNFVLDSEPFGAAICKALERTDYDRLDHLAAVNGEYMLKVTNELNETQHINELKLLVVDHLKGTRLVTDSKGQIHTIISPVYPLSACDQFGQDILACVEKNEHFYWKSNLFNRNPNDDKNLYDELLVEFPKPPGAQTAKLVTNACITFWNIYMAKEFVELLGHSSTTWITRLSQNAQLLHKFKSHFNEQGFLKFKVQIRENGDWKTVGYVRGATPLIPKDQVISFDVSQIKGDRLKVKLKPGAGFWMIDQVFVDYSDNLPVHLTELTAIRTTDHKGGDIHRALNWDDSMYYTMPESGDSAKITFAVPPKSSAMNRSVILKIKGYYEIHTTGTSQPQIPLFVQLLKKPGALSRYSLTKFQELFETDSEGMQ